MREEKPSIYTSRILWSKYQTSLNSGLLSVFYCGLDMHSFNTKNMLNLPNITLSLVELSSSQVAQVCTCMRCRATEITPLV